MCRKKSQIISYILIFAVLLCSLPLGSLNLSAQNTSAVANDTLLSEYDKYIKDKNDALNDIKIPIDKVTTVNTDVAVVEDELFWKDGKGSINFSVAVTESALYNLEIVWKAANSGVDPQFSLMIDGKYPFSNTEEIVLPREWKNATKEPRKDANGNESAQEQIETGEYIKTVIFDHTGVIIDPYKFYLSKGVHTLSFKNVEQGIYIKSLTLKAPEKVEDYSEVSKNYKLEKNDAETIILEGENADIKSSNSIIPKSNNSDVGMTPSDSKTTKINYIGGTGWKSPTSKLTWKFDVSKDGYYYVNMRYKQSNLVNAESLRWLKIDGKTPFSEAKELSFDYNTSWEYFTFGSQDSPYYIYLTKGEHTISLEATLGKQSEYFYRLKEIVDILGNEYIKIIMITSEIPDPNRDYALFKQIPNFTETLTKSRDSLLGLIEDMKADLGEDTTQSIATMENMVRVLNNMLRSPYIAQQYLTDYYSNYTSLGAWLYDMVNMPLSLDRIQIIPFSKNYINTDGNFFENLSFGFVRFVLSFATDYSVSSNDESEKSVRLWINWGQDQALALNSLIEDSFTPKTGINVNLEIVNASLIYGILAGNFPDVAIQMSRTEPVNLGIRGALYDLRNFDDCDEVLKNFQKDAQVPYEYGDALYALPDTQNYFLMFYRKDILEQLGLEVPKTWEEFFYCTTIIQRNNMNVYVPYSQITASTTVNSGIGCLNLYPTLMNQNGLKFYNDKKNGTVLQNKKAINVFENWTDFYVEYNINKEADFFNRFRGGTMPLGIAPYNTYMTLYSAAPEIRGRWGIELVPGTKLDNGDIDYSVAGAGTGCAIVDKSDNKDEAWEFLKWWTSGDVQTRFSNNVESILGTIGRINTSNVEAFHNLSWEMDDLKILSKQWSMVKEIPEVPGSYYLTRSIDQAFWSVLNDESSVTDAVVKWSEIADEEIQRKIKEYS